jgi:putative spermidine/putrescine transport system substrate-binding protein/spermidine/putrescine transport system substrate-binding protein
MMCFVVGGAIAGCGSDDDEGGGGGNAAAESDAPRELRLLTWEGYTEDEWVKPFEEEHNVEIKSVYVGSDDDLFAKVKSGGGKDFDLITTNRAHVPLFVEQGVLKPIDTSRLSNFDGLTPVFQEDEQSRVDGELYVTPFVWSNVGIIYDKKKFPTPPDSWADVFEPEGELCGRTLLSEDAGTAISIAAMYLGHDNVYNLSDEQLEEAKDLLKKAAECSKAFYAGFGDAAQYFGAGEVDLGIQLGSLVTTLAQEKGADVANTVPKEGSLWWMDAWGIMPGAEGKEDLVYEWLDYLMSAEVQLKMTKSTGFGPVREDGVADQLDAKTRETLHLGDPSFFENLSPMLNPEAPDSWDKRLKLWNEVKAGA